MGRVGRGRPRRILGLIDDRPARKTLRIAARAALEREGASRAGRAWRLLVGRPDAGAAERYGVALGLTAVALLSALLLGGDRAGFRVVVYVAAVSLAALRGGVGPGSIALAACSAAYAAGHGGSPAWRQEPDPVHRLLFLAGFSALAVWAASALRDGYRQTYARRRRAEARADAHRVAAELGVRALAEENLESLLAETLSAVRRTLRCDSVTLLELQPGGDGLLLRHASGLARARIGGVFGPAEAPLAFRALLAREPLVVDDLRHEPELASPPLLAQGIVSSLVAPVVVAGPAGRAFGVMGAHARTLRAFTVDDAAFLQTAANVVGTGVVRLRADEQVRRTLASERFLADASRQLALSIDWQATLARVARLALPFLGDWCLVVVVDPDGHPRSVVAEALDPATAAAAQELMSRYPVDLGATHGVGRILRTGEPELIPEVVAESFVVERGDDAEVRREILRRLGLRSYLGVPLAGRRVLGAIAFGVSSGTRRYGPDDLRLAEALAQRCAAALENASLYRAAQEATRAREQVLEVVSHDLKAPLGALLMGAQMVDRLAPAGAAGDELRRASGTVRRAAQRMGRLIHDLVDGASIEAGGLSLQLAPHEARAVAAEAVDALREVAHERGVALGLRCEATPKVACDRDRIIQVLCNLVTNALQVTDEGGQVEVAVRHGAEGEVCFTVSDDGPGIPPDDLPHIFERWYRGRGARRYPGTGLGLAIAHAIVSAHGGRIWAEPREGAGTTFSFALPPDRGARPAASR